MSSESKIRDKVLTHAVLMQVTEKAMENLHDYPEINYECMEEIFENPAEIEPEFVHHSIRFLEECEKQSRTLSSNSVEKLEIDNVKEDDVDLDVLLFKGKVICGVKQLIARNNPFTGTRCSKKQYEDSFKRLHEKDISILTMKKHKNVKKVLHFEKKDLHEMDAETLDNFPIKIIFGIR